MRTMIVFAAVTVALVSMVVLAGVPAVTAVPAAPAAGCHPLRERIIANARVTAVPFSAGCSADVDCVLVDPSVACQTSCPVAILAKKAQAFTAALRQFEASACSEGALAECGAMPACAASMATPVACEAGKCVVVLPVAPSAAPAPTAPAATAASNGRDGG